MSKQAVTKRGKQWRRRKGVRREFEYHLSSLPPETQAALLVRHGAGAGDEGPAVAPAPSVGPATRAHPGPAVADAAPAPPCPNPRRPDAAAQWAWYARQSERAKQEASRRLRLLGAVERLISHGNGNGPGRGRRRARETVAREAGEHPSTLYRWGQMVAGVERADWLAYLAPQLGAGGRARAELDPAAWELFKADYLRLERPAVRECHERLVRAAAARGWAVPSPKTFERRVREMPLATRVLARQGVEALARMFPAQERDRSCFRALEAVNADGHTFDVFVRWPDGTVERPRMVAWQDLLSGKLVSYRVDLTENADAVRLSFADLLTLGIPEDAYLDNGRGFASKWITGGTPNRYRFTVREEEPPGVLTLLGVRVHWVTPYHGQAKPIERAFRDLCGYVAKHPAFSGAYTGNKPDAKPENYGSRAVPLAQFLQVLSTEIAAHNARAGRRGGVCAGRSFDQVFAESYARGPVRVATPEQRRLCLLAGELATARGNGEIVLAAGAVATIDGAPARAKNRYWAPELAELKGQRVMVRFDPQRLHAPVAVYSVDGRYLCDAACVEPAAFNDTEAGRAQNRDRNRWVKAGKEQLAAERRMSAREAARMLPEVAAAELPDPKVVRPFRLPEPAAARPVACDRGHDDARAVQALVIEMARAREAEPDPALMDDVERYKHWCALDRRAQAGELLPEASHRFYMAFRTTPLWRAFDEMEREFGVGGGAGQ
ncbi:MAG: transposase domain-containing protein [Thermodesulfobacteriota bacterium]